MWNASLAQMGAGLGRLSNASLKIRQNRIVAYASCGFTVGDMYWTDELAYGAELKRRETQKTRDCRILRRPLETSTFRPWSREGSRRNSWYWQVKEALPCDFIGAVSALSRSRSRHRQNIAM